MPYEFVVWHGSPPLSNAHAASEYKRHRAAATGGVDPDQSIRELLARLTAVYPDRVDNRHPIGPPLDSPWVDSPLRKQASGSLAVIRVETARADEVRSLLTETCEGRGLVVYDPHRRAMVPSAVAARRTVRFQLPQPNQLAVHLNALFREQLGADTPVVGVLDHLPSNYYLQWLAEPGAVTVEAQRRMVPDQGAGAAVSGSWGHPEQRMMSLGFEPGQPNWCRRCRADGPGIAEAARAVCAVLFDVQDARPGDGVSIQTFPVHGLF